LGVGLIAVGLAAVPESPDESLDGSPDESPDGSIGAATD
jgi:hypothetical protein